MITTDDVDSRHLPLVKAGSVEAPSAIQGFAETVERTTFWAEHSHATHELLWNERGASTATIGSRTWTITSTIGLWIPAGSPHSGWMPAGTRHRAAQFSIDAAPALAATAVAVDLSPLLLLLLDRLGGEDIGDSSRTTTEAMVLDILSPAPHELLLSTPVSDLLSPIAAALESDPADGRTLAEWATELGVSGRTITRAFQTETGLGFSRWIATARVQHAIGLLARGEDIEEIAARVGFRSASAFGTAFRRVTGTSPGRFRAL